MGSNSSPVGDGRGNGESHRGRCALVISKALQHDSAMNIVWFADNGEPTKQSSGNAIVFQLISGGHALDLTETNAVGRTAKIASVHKPQL